MDRPEISEEATEAMWKVFLSDWEHYKASQEVNKIKDIYNELLNCCSKEVRSSLANARGQKVATMNDDELVAKIKKMAVWVSHVSIHRKAFHKMKQDKGENFTHWVTH